MPLSSGQLKQIKEQLLKQISQLPENQRESIKAQILGMNDAQFEQFLRQNKMIKDNDFEEDEQNTEDKEQKCIFCSIIEGKVPSYKLDENKSSVAILEINPLSKGHSLILSKNHDNLPNSAFSLANKVAKRIKSRLKPEEVKIENSKVFGHESIQIIPVYKNEKLEKKKATEEELVLLKDKLKSKPKKKREKKARQVSVSNLPKVPRRFP